MGDSREADETMDFGKQMRVMRVVRELTQKELAAKVGCVPLVLSFIETGQMQPTQELEAKIRQELGFAEAYEEALEVLLQGAPQASAENI